MLGLPAHAQDFPNKQIRIIVPFAPGASTDVLARLVGGRLRAKWGQPIIVENRSGDGGNIGAAEVFNAKPDGYTLLVSPPSTLVVNKSLYAKLADAYLFGVLNWTNVFKIDIGKWPNIKAFMARVGARPAVQATMKAEGLIK